MLEISGLTVDYSGVIALDQVSLNADTGKVSTLIGANGAGKSSLLKAISGLVRPAGGSIRFDGETVLDQSPDALVRRGICHVPEGRGLFPYMSVMDNLLSGAHLRRDAAGIRQDLDKVFHYFPVLKQHRHRIARNFSGGQQQMIAIGRGIMQRPRFYLFDEPSIGLAPLVTREVIGAITAIARQDRCGVLLVEQNANLALDAAEDAYVIELGRISLSGSAAELKNDERVRRAYLGL
ncbi:amino acid/amide ABC transporter ATP-binding protein 2, HAAT family [Paracoccus thiocyanatus]|uniref:Amino acid/amide ABC transporter ATP-binding protein 2, HAAT family n=1 Tax=Paracoccus thiocyanatus TaxID=34006 RepID=A0A1N6U7I5_9RHOB|nr:ABC transporter ATP-binding protein [Paracoccus thiocyanatus]SIQ61563.1 amino acid/amide ABC transporter ATP-binding protein 2, HAAT family [Paracoccus thiocyanatus]